MDGLEPSTLYARAGHACPEPNLAIAWQALNQHLTRLQRQQATPTNAQFSLDAIHSNYRREENQTSQMNGEHPGSPSGIRTQIESGHSVPRNARFFN
jgi:hypothetical protein